MPNTTQVMQRYTKRVNNTNVLGDTWTGQNVPGGGSTAASTVNNRGTIKRAGTIGVANTSKWASAVVVYPNYIASGCYVYLSDDTVITKVNGAYTSRNITFRANVSGNFATMAKGAYVARRLTTTLAGLSNTTLRSGSSDYQIRRSIHKVESYRQSFMKGITFLVASQSIAALTDGSTRYNDYTIVYSNQTSGYMGQNSSATLPINLGTGVDASATPSLAVPGQLIFKGAGALATLATYKARFQG